MLSVWTCRVATDASARVAMSLALMGGPVSVSVFSGSPKSIDTLETAYYTLLHPVTSFLAYEAARVEWFLFDEGTTVQYFPKQELTQCVFVSEVF